MRSSNSIAWACRRLPARESLLAVVGTGMLTLGLAGSAAAIPTVNLFWFGTSGTGTIGGGTINAAAGDTLSLAIDVTETGFVTGTQFASVSLTLSLLGTNTMYSGPVDVVEGVECPSPPYVIPGLCHAPGPLPPFLAGGGQGPGVQIGPAGAGDKFCPTGTICAWDAGPSALGIAGTFRLGNAIFTAGASSEVISTFYRATADAVISDSIAFFPSASASINVPSAVPEPSSAPLLGLGLAALGASASQRRGRRLGRRS